MKTLEEILKNDGKYSKMKKISTNSVQVQFGYFFMITAGFCFIGSFWVILQMLIGNLEPAYFWAISGIPLTGFITWAGYLMTLTQRVVKVDREDGKIYVIMKDGKNEGALWYDIADIKEYGIMNAAKWDHDSTAPVSTNGKNTLFTYVGYIHLEKIDEDGEVKSRYIGLYSGRKGYVKKMLQKAKRIIEFEG